MEINAEESIQRWLANVPEGPPSQPDCEGLNTTGFESNGKLSTALEPSDTGPAIRWPNINKRPRDENADSGQCLHPRDVGNRYERRPRRKTRDDKYEYKRPGSPRKRLARSHKDKGKRTRTNRKHAMNDAFHASNVARERLTLRNTMNMGIFSKGKASSPIKLRDAPDLSFSETRFLAQKDQVPLGTGTGAGTGFDESPLQKKLSQHSRPKISHYVFREPSKVVATERPTIQHTALSVQLSQGDQWHPSGPQGITPSTPAAASAAQCSLGKKQAKLQRSQGQLPHSDHESRSPTPYSWSVSDRRGSQQSRKLEDRLLKILHTGLSPRSLDEVNNSPGSMKGYCNIQDLRGLLESRKTHWLPQTSIHGMTTCNEAPESLAVVTETAQGLEKVTIAQFESSEAALKSGNRPSHIQKTPDGLFCIPQRNQVRSQEDEVPKDLSPSSQQHRPVLIEPKSVGLDLEDDDAFFQKLDAAYCLIFEPEGVRPEPLGLGPIVRHGSNWSIAKQTHNHGSISSRRIHPSLCESIDTLLCGQLGLDVLPTFANPSHRPHEELTAFPQSDIMALQALERHSTGEVLVQGPEVAHRFHLSGPLPANASEQFCPPVPPEFWRQKRLY